MPSRYWGQGSTRAWRRIRALVLDRDQHRCQLQLDGCTWTATQVHHLDGKRMGDNPDRCVAACEHCNKSLGEPGRGGHDPDPSPRTAW